MLGRCDDVWKKMMENNIEGCLFDMYQLKPNPITESMFDKFHSYIICRRTDII